MYGAEAKHANYYLPVQHEDNGDEIPPNKKRCTSVAAPHHATHILGRRYALTPTAFKYLEIGISVGVASSVDLFLGDNRGNRLILHMPTWGGLMTKREDIQQLLDTSETSSTSLKIRDLTVERCIMRGIKMVKLSLSDKCIYLTPTTMNTLFNFEHCIEHMYAWLWENMHLVNMKFKNFVNILREKNITEACYAAPTICASKDFDSGSLIDCELLACALNDIMYEVLNK